MSDIEMRAHLLTVEYLRFQASVNKIGHLTTPEVYAHIYKNYYNRIIAELRKPS